MSQKIAVRTERAPAAPHAFSQGVRKGGMFQVSGQGAVDPATGEHIAPDDVAAQTARTLENIRAILEAGDATVDDVIMFRVYLTRREDFDGMNAAYEAFIAEHAPSGVLPCRTTVFTGLPHPDMLVEIDALAVIDQST
ncbi:RidA family protein [Leucobacter sp. gxy201]|uniref:RidA family protein n=1 Tax=Leucobacter sp. gxy201 TaxID=2957200 RepID=UPI003DA03C33